MARTLLSHRERLAIPRRRHGSWQSQKSRIDFSNASHLLLPLFEKIVGQLDELMG
jgi:hypothetical protein